jgi:hypothetical protein
LATYQVRLQAHICCVQFVTAAGAYSNVVGAAQIALLLLAVFFVIIGAVSPQSHERNSTNSASAERDFVELS